MPSRLEKLVTEIRACRICVESPRGRPLPHEPRPVLRVSRTARIAVCGQAPGTRVHASGVPFSDPSGVRLRAWMGVTEPEFYDVARIAIVPMGFCFPGLAVSKTGRGQDAKGGDLPPRRECALAWRARLMAEMPQLELMLLVGQYAQRWHLGEDCGPSLGETVANWRAVLARPGSPRMLPLPHPSWRNNAWLGANPWFGTELVPRLKHEVRLRLDPC